MDSGREIGDERETESISCVAERRFADCRFNGCSIKRGGAIVVKHAPDDPRLLTDYKKRQCVRHGSQDQDSPRADGRDTHWLAGRLWSSVLPQISSLLKAGLSYVVCGQHYGRYGLLAVLKPSVTQPHELKHSLAIAFPKNFPTAAVCIVSTFEEIPMNTPE